MIESGTIFGWSVLAKVPLRKWLAVLTVVAASALSVERVQAQVPSRPNILVMIVDDMGWADLGVQGSIDAPTPNIDSIAKDGVRLTNAYVSAPVCSPSRAGLLTGRYQTRFGHELNHPMADRGPVGLPVEEQLWPVYFKNAGYVTGHAGKWHLGNTQMTQFTPNARGFQDSYHFAGAQKLPHPKLPYSHNGKPEQSDEAYVDDGIAASACQFINSHKSEPWFFYTAFLTPHEPMDLPNGVEDRFSGTAEVKRRKFLAAMSLMDADVGRILKTLKETGQDERTLVIFLSDNGAPTGNGSLNTPFQGSKSTLWEGGIRSPFLIRWTGSLPAGGVLDQPVISLDLLATALSAAKIPASSDHPLDGVNLLPLLKGETTAAPHEFLFWRYGDQWAVRSGNWKLVHAGKAKEAFATRLVNLQDDLSEAHDLSEQHPEIRARLQTAWDDWNRSNVPALWGK
ncbi:sulfatase-like hydrolase/transferase [Planctomicrobium piriforme]|uniref:Arylsulfatase A n=1 Tax=Planctomicrobium piriforme TaxID=1576369 RepID=A0A1I3JCJ8_9PLAN|nr:sulfatase-like hydrolase/transferase [Planctomicrobium piriforme]SFI57992.1 Arylsulfatase A [Planctomicrobium piriforme]